MKHLIAPLLAGALLGLPGWARAGALELPAAAPAQRTVGLVEQWRLGEDEEDVLLGSITSGLLDDAGQIYLVDRQLAQVLVIDPEGQLVSTLGRPGDGPGELGHPHGLVSLPDGNVGAIEGFPGRIVGLKPNGDPAGEIVFGTDSGDGGFKLLTECLRFGDRFVVNSERLVFDTESGQLNRHSSLGVYDTQGALVQVIAEHQRTGEMTRQIFDEAAQFSEFLQWSAGPIGVIYTTPEREQYLIKVVDFQGQTQRLMHREFPPRHRSKTEKEAMTSSMKMVVNGKPLEVENKALDFDQTIRDLAVAPDGRLFITNAYQHRSLLPVGTAARYDVISPTGEFLTELTLTWPGFDGKKDRLVFLDGTHYLAIMNENDDQETEETEADAEPLAVVLLHLP